MPVFALKNSCFKTFWKTPENSERLKLFILIRFFPLSFAKSLLMAVFSEHSHGFAFAMTYCLQKVGKKKVLGRISCDNFFLIVLLTSSSITIYL